ncbi:MAG: class I SAM-dependent methyltransferase, partial [Eubacteriales bacterium]|nr:class I SAM-dependent methyltransferase [Eubacteriales bacterium]
MKTIDERVLAGYNAGIEKNRLRAGVGLIEWQRTCQLLAEFLPPPPAVVYDVGGGYGEYSWHLAARGYDVHLFDIAPGNIEMSAALAGEYPGVSLAAAHVCDARAVPRGDRSADAVLLMGPLYHIVERQERLSALRECRRLLKPGGLLFTAAITRYATTLWALTAYGAQNTLLTEDAFRAMLLRELTDGQHIRPENSSYRGMGRSFFHLPGQLADELAEAGFLGNDVRGILGGGWLVPNLDDVWRDEAARAAI